MSNHWMMNTSFSYNNTIVNKLQPARSPTALPEDPKNIEQRDGYQYDDATAGSGIGNVFVNAKWLFKLSGMYSCRAQFNVSAFYNARQGYPSSGGPGAARRRRRTAAARRRRAAG